ncbi:MAG: DNAJ heat shock N-terminal domain-containing protein [Piptocephalis tieghemiana]|nr:MAG: DNAJ heat shock N-terminal domain-containing protein [Piptocephalis tieghemiana]
MGFQNFAILLSELHFAPPPSYLPGSAGMSGLSANTSYYEVLGVGEKEDRESIKQAYQRLLLKHHPDKQQSKDTIGEEDRVQRVVEAWKVLGDTTSRALYDRQLGEQRRIERGVVSAEVDLDEMEYDEASETWTSPCRCGQEYVVSVEDLEEGIDVIGCAGCSLRIRVLYEEEDASSSIS